MAYSLRSRSGSVVKPENEPSAPAAKKASVKKTQAAPRKTPAKKVAPASNKSVDSAKKAVPAPKKAASATQEPKPVKPDALVKKVAAKKTAAPKKSSASSSKKEPASKKVIKAVSPKAKAPPRKAAQPKKAVTEEIKPISVIPVVKIEEIDEELKVPSISEPEIEPISHEEEKVIEILENEVVSTHVRFSVDEDDEPASFEMNNSQKIESESESESEVEVEAEAEVEVENNDQEDFGIKEEMNETFEEIKEVSPVSNPHSAFEVFTSQEEPKTFNWSHPGSTYYQEKSESEAEEKESFSESEPEPEPEIVKIDNMPSVSNAKEENEEDKTSPIVISNPFGFGFTTTTPAPIEKEKKEVAASALNILGSSAVNVSKPNPYSTSFNSHFQSVSSPLDKLCNLTNQSNPISGSSNFENNANSSSMITSSSYLPTSPAAGISKSSRSPSIHDGDKEARSPSVIQSIIIDDKHEDFSAF